MEEPKTYDGRKVVIWLGVAILVGVTVLVLLLLATRDRGAEEAGPPAPSAQAAVAETTLDPT